MSVFITKEKTSWEKIKSSQKPVVIYGMGDGADKVLAEFEKLGIKISSVIASDDFVRGQSFHGFTVETLSQAHSRLGDILIVVCFASQLPDVMAHIKKVAQDFEVIVPSVPVFGKSIFNREFVNANIENIEKTYHLLADDRSRLVFENTISFQLTGKLSYLFEMESDKSEVFENIIKLGCDEDFVDLGAYRGDTIEEFLHYCGGKYSSITALEPDKRTFKKLQKFTENMKNTSIFNKGAYSCEKTLMFSDKSGRASSISDTGKCVPVEVTSVDSLLDGKRASYIKMDIEGAEAEAIKGAENTIRKYKPKLNIAIYHRSEDIFALPKLIHRINPDYKFYMRHHPYIPCWDSNLYCV